MENAVEGIVDPSDSYDLNKDVYLLLADEPVFAVLSRYTTKHPSTAIPTAGVKIDADGDFDMVYNKKFMYNLPIAQRKGVLKHEFLHLLLDHVSTRLPEGGMSKLWNVATDLAINSHLQGELPSMCCMPGEGMFADMPPGLSAEEYYYRLKKKSDDGKGGEGGEGGDKFGDSFDDHGEWDNSGEPNDELRDKLDVAKQKLDKILRQAHSEITNSNAGWGSIPENMKKAILERIYPSVNWKNVLREFIKNSKRAHKTNTVKRVNRRYPFIHAGSRISRVANIAISIDQSGSVSDEMLVSFFTELDNLAKIATFTVVPFDEEVDDSLVFEWKKGKRFKPERVKCGGTNFSAPTKYVNDRGNFDAHIVLTDMYAEKPIASTVQRMWMTDQNGANAKYFTTNERIIVIK